MDLINGDNQSVRTHTFSELLIILGQPRQIDGLQVTVTENERKAIPIFYPFRFDQYFVCMVSAGELSLKLNLVNHVIREGEFVLIEPGTICQFTGSSEFISSACISFSNDFLLKAGIYQKYISAFKLLGPNLSTHLVLEKEEIALLSGIFKMLYANIVTREKNEFSQEIIQHNFSLVIYELINVFYHHHQELKSKPTRKQDITARFMKLLIKWYKEERSVQFYAGQLAITPRYLTQTVKEVAGKTAGDLIDEMVITEAMILLNDPACSIGQVAVLLQFSDQFFFSKFFKNKTGLTPSEYRKSKQQTFVIKEELSVPSQERILSDIT
ncbi:helix-turn-helix domain-containing protein [Parachryseolinea silvisoli]|uniref:helix-turn-helix domain-containing protein n=1 Tax=Parachryseolinea silvisoli TaxID=2873601 RepID=UPI002265E779|nr:helix-turn-helix domain-containing protein [Parachryseolinea silvisoli]MCD9015618.1 helix-turn-helix domain-containing protein [Parachryseolinea silvisoli]